ncbi:MAG: TetR/AcrR family transcriptional regulator [Actinomycetota bacterium]|nr:TetR/AcrR family transcriptional regulator [Actinomycetota bacterium]
MVEARPDEQSRSRDGGPPAARGRGGPRPHGDRRRVQIIDTAIDLFSAKGFHAVSLREIADKVGISQAGLLHHFPTKAALLMSVLHDREDKNREDEERRRAEGADAIEVFLHILEENEKNPVLVQLYALLSAEGLSTEHPAHEWWSRRYTSIVRSMATQLAEVIDESTLPAGVTLETVARWLIALGDGLRMQWLLDRDSVNRAETVEQFVALVRSITGPANRRTPGAAPDGTTGP